MQEDKRAMPKEYWSNIKGFLICTVVAGHIIQIFFEYFGYEKHLIMQGIINFIYLFHMPMFTFVSGFLSKDFTKRRERAFEDLLVPYLLLQICWLIFRFLAYQSADVIKNIFYPQFGMWYLLALYIWRMILPDLSRVRSILPISFMLYIAGMFFTGIDNTMALQRTIGFLCFFLLGYYFPSERVRRLRNIVSPFWGGSGLVIILVGIIFIFYRKMFSYVDFWSSLVHSKYITMSNSWEKGVLLYIMILTIT